MSELLQKREKRVAGLKQALRAMEAGRAEEVFLAEDAAEYIARRVSEAADAAGLPVTKVESMASLGRMCRVQVPTAVACVLKTD